MKTYKEWKINESNINFKHDELKWAWDSINSHIDYAKQKIQIGSDPIVVIDRMAQMIHSQLIDADFRIPPH